MTVLTRILPTNERTSRPQQMKNLINIAHHGSGAL